MTKGALSRPNINAFAAKRGREKQAKAERRKEKAWKKQRKELKQTEKGLAGNVTKCFRKMGQKTCGIQAVHCDNSVSKGINIVKNWII